MYRSDSQKSLIDKVHITRHPRDLVTPEADVIIPEEPDNGRRYEVVIQRQLLLSPTRVPHESLEKGLLSRGGDCLGGEADEAGDPGARRRGW